MQFRCETTDSDSEDSGIADVVLDPQNNVCTSRGVMEIIFHVTFTHVVASVVLSFVSCNKKDSVGPFCCSW